jgi:hypothetical protein
LALYSAAILRALNGTRLTAAAIAFAGAFAGVFALSSASASAHLPVLLTQDANVPFQVRPAIVAYTGDGTGYLGGARSSPHHTDRGRIHWLTWNRRRGFGRATVWINNCRPNCARGQFSPHRGAVRVRRVRHGAFTRLTIHFRYRGRWRYDHRLLVKAGSDFFWGICDAKYTPHC